MNRNSGLALLVLVGLGCASAADSGGAYRYERLCMGVKTAITLHARDVESARLAAEAAFARIAAVDAAVSDYRPESEAMQLCRTGSAIVGEDLWSLLVAAREVWQRSDGAFDVTVGPFSQLWREAARTNVAPSEAALRAARERTGFDKVILDAATRRVHLVSQGMRLDFGGIAKGYAAEAAVQVLRQSGHPSCLVALAGDVCAGSAPPGSPGWRIDLVAREGEEPFETLWLADAAVSTSGGSAQSLSIGARTLVHVVDPRRGDFSRRVATASVVATRGADADAWATAFALLGAGRAEQIVARLPRTALLVREQSTLGKVLSIVDPENVLRRAPPQVDSRPSSRP